MCLSDIVYVGNLHPQHRDTVIAALNANKHVLCEKPMGMSLAEVQEMVACARNQKKFLMEVKSYNNYGNIPRKTSLTCA